MKMKENGHLDNEKRALLVMGPRAHKDGKLGGVVVLFELFLDQLRERGIRYHVIDLNSRNYSNFANGVVSILWQIIRHIKSAQHVSLHGTASHFVYLAPILVLLTRILAKPVSLRKFAGSFDSVFDSLIYAKKIIVVYALSRATVCFFETQYLVKKFMKYNSETYWLPNVRTTSEVSRSAERPYQRRFVFIGHIREEKGVDIVLRAAQHLGDEYSFTLVGQLASKTYEKLDWAQYPNVRYRGQIPASDIPAALSEHDVLLLPTYWEGEGYPGVIIEAFQCGLPVIATDLQGIREMIDDGQQGYLIEPKNSEALVEAICRITNDNYHELSTNASERSRQFDSDRVTDDFLRLIGWHGYRNDNDKNAV